MSVERNIIQGTLAEVSARLCEIPGGRGLAAVLKLIERELMNSILRVAPNLRRALVSLPSGERAIVRISTGRPALGGSVRLRFKRPAAIEQYSYLFFGGMTADGNAFVRKLSPTDIGRLKTITIKSDGRDTGSGQVS